VPCPARPESAIAVGYLLAGPPRHGDDVIAGAGKLLGNAEAEATASAGDENLALGVGLGASHVQPCRRASLPVAATASAGTKLIAAGIL
jgi:hypothetical protein